MVLLPILLLTAGAVLLSIVQVRKRRLSWVFGLGVALVVLAASLLLKGSVPGEVRISAWQPESLFNAQLELVLDRQSWQLLIMTTALLLAVFLKGYAAEGVETRHIRGVALVYPALSLMALLAGNLLTLAIAWTLLDICFLWYVLVTSRQPALTPAVAQRLAVHMFSVLLLLAVVIFNRAANGGSELVAPLESFWAEAALFAAAILRLWGGLMAISLFTEPETNTARLMILLAPATALAAVARQSGFGLSSQVAVGLQVVGLIAIFYGSILLLLFERHAWKGFVLGLAGWGLLVSAIAPGAGGLQGAILTITLLGSTLFLGRQHALWHRAVLLLVSLGVLGLPGFPAEVLISGLVQPGGMRLVIATAIPGLGLLGGGLLLRAMDPPRPWQASEKVAQALFGAGMLFPPLIALAIAAGEADPRRLPAVLIFALVGVLAAGSAFSIRRLSRRRTGEPTTFVLRLPALPLGRRAMSLMMGSMRDLGEILEGEGGMLWLIVILAAGLLISQGGGG